MSEGWIILRCQGRSTLRLAASLAEDGYEVWSPVIREVRSVPSRNAKREVESALMPGFVFVDREHLIDMLELAGMPVKPRRGAGRLKAAHPDFSVFHYFDRIPMVADRDLNPLRRLARRRTIAPKAMPLKRYQTVRALEGTGSLQGMIGTVQESNERQTVVSFGGLFHSVEIPTSLLRVEDVNRLLSATDVAQKRAA